jgi:hypothetical protein
MNKIALSRSILDDISVKGYMIFSQSRATKYIAEYLVQKPYYNITWKDKSSQYVETYSLQVLSLISHSRLQLT